MGPEALIGGHGSEPASAWVRRWSPWVKQGGHVLDVACGLGRHTRWFLARGHSVCAVDRSGEAIDAVLAAAVERGAVPHVAAIVADAEGVFYEGGAGVRVQGESEDPVTTSTQFRIMSMTKMVATTCALQQKERGELDFAAPIEEYVPEWADVQVLDGWDGDTPRLRAPATKATVHQLVTHTTGLGYWFWNEDLVRFEAATGTPNVVPGSMDAFKAPLTADPGTAFVYGINTDWLGRVVEAVAGATLDVVVKEHVTEPLGMHDTMFRLDAGRSKNLVTVHVPGDDGWTSAGEILNQEPDWWAGGHGLYSTPRDYIRFERALLRGLAWRQPAQLDTRLARRGVAHHIQRIAARRALDALDQRMRLDGAASVGRHAVADPGARARGPAAAFQPLIKHRMLLLQPAVEVGVAAHAPGGEPEALRLVDHGGPVRRGELRGDLGGGHGDGASTTCHASGPRRSQWMTCAPCWTRATAPGSCTRALTRRRCSSASARVCAGVERSHRREGP